MANPKPNYRYGIQHYRSMYRKPRQIPFIPYKPSQDVSLFSEESSGHSTTLHTTSEESVSSYSTTHVRFHSDRDLAGLEFRVEAGTSSKTPSEE